MRTLDWTRRLASLDRLGKLLDLPDAAVEWSGICPEARAPMVAAMLAGHPRKALIVTPNYDRALAWQAKLQLCGVPAERIRQLPSGGSALFEDAAPEHIALSDRLGSLRALTEEEPWVVIATPQAALERTVPRETLLEAYVAVGIGDELDPVAFAKRLENLGYEPAEPVRIPGQYSRRGGILDVYATGHDFPYRIELFGDEVESIRVFDPNTQRSIQTVDRLALAPSRETMYAGGLEHVLDMVRDSLERESATLPDEAATRLEELVGQDLKALGGKVYFDRLDLYRPLLYTDSGCAVDLLGEGDLLILDEPRELDAVTARAEDELAQALSARAARGEILRATASDFMLPPDHLGARSGVLAMSAMDGTPDWMHVTETREVSAASLEPYRGRAEALAQTLKTYREQGFSIVFTSDQPNRATAVLANIDVFPTADASDHETGFTAGAFLAHGNLGGGFVLPQDKVAFFTDAELFGVARLRLPQRRFLEGAPIATVLDLKPGDYVVHIHFGIGRYMGLVKREEQGMEKEYLFLQYAPPDKLFVPADQLDRVQKYLNPGDETPKLNRLTGGEWQRTLGKAKEEAREFARDLIKLYAVRKGVQRKPFGSDTPWQSEMESTFPWVETPSQLGAIRDVKRDLQNEYPMDRLVCGDVGFGKTEVAIRAAFKVAQSGRQVAVLCPTTILSEQHARNFADRLGSFGVRIGLLNRYTHATEKRRILQGLQEGTVDLVLGTHSLLAKDIKFKDLGLVIIDEEQKFGVKQKEVLKQLRSEVDVLSMSATPIPRTLSMALMDIRQMSLINDPPPGRLPIRTFVRPYADEVVREAILRELARGGQVFYVYNRVQSIGHAAEKLRRLIPTARIGVGHGQMSESQLEPIMIGFIKGEIDILLSTTIIENGIDISNANTLLVEDADRLGLSQLYQLRGRVGRSDRQAYAYFLYNHRELGEGALARLQALQEFSSLGSGYSLAFRDLQIRGAGELLGAKQHGAMAAVGYELYSQLINEAVLVLKSSVDGEMPSLPGEPTKDPLASLAPLPTFELPVVALIPEGFIRDQAQRLYYYQRMMSARDEATLGEVQAEVEDRYGHLPEEASRAFAIMALRMRAQQMGIDKLDARGGRISASFADRASLPGRLVSLLQRKHREFYATRESFIWPYTGDPLSAVEGFFGAIQSSLDQIEADREALGI